MTLTGKGIIVTGAATGIGGASALGVARRGARVAAFDVNDVAGAGVVEAITEEDGTARYWHVDVAVEAEVAAAVTEAIAWLGGDVDVLLHLAGVLQGACGHRRLPGGDLGHGAGHQPQGIVPGLQARGRPDAAAG